MSAVDRAAAAARLRHRHGHEPCPGRGDVCTETQPCDLAMLLTTPGRLPAEPGAVDEDLVAAAAEQAHAAYVGHLRGPKPYRELHRNNQLRWLNAVSAVLAVVEARVREQVTADVRRQALQQAADKIAGRSEQWQMAALRHSAPAPAGIRELGWPEPEEERQRTAAYHRGMAAAEMIVRDLQPLAGEVAS